MHLSKTKPLCDRLRDDLYGEYYEVVHVEGDMSLVLL